MENEKQQKIAGMLAILLPVIGIIAGGIVAFNNDIYAGLCIATFFSLWEGCTLVLVLEKPEPLKCPKCGHPLGSFSGNLNVVSNHGDITIAPIRCRFCQASLVVRGEVTRFVNEIEKEERDN
jgi:hypothetical protein